FVPARAGAAKDEREFIGTCVRDAERHIRTSLLPQELDGITALRRRRPCPQAIGELLEALLDQTVEERLLVLEVNVEVAVRAADLLGELPHGDALIAVAREGLSRRVENRSPQHVAVPGAGTENFRLTLHDQWS